MGMYTEIHFASDLKKDTPQEIIDLLHDLINGHAISPSRIPKHEFFETDRCHILFEGNSAYFDAFISFTLTKNEFSEAWLLQGTTNLKNYNREIQKFIDWITPYLDKHSGEYIGHIWYEEWDKPVPILFKTPIEYPAY